MSSSSRSDTQSTNSTEDSRIAADGSAIAIGRGAGVVQIDQVPDEAFDMVSDSLNLTGHVVDRVLKSSEDMVRRSESETKQLSEIALKFGIPALALAFVAAKVM